MTLPKRQRGYRTGVGMTTAKPFLKWVGGKRQLVDAIRTQMPSDHGRYFEPFIGGGALFFALHPPLAVISDSNERLVRTYRAIRDDVESVIGVLETYPYDRAFYQRMRELDVDRCAEIQVAAWFLYVNRAGFNGLYRVNKAGRFNVPFGKYTNPTICDAGNLRACSLALRGVDIRHADFEEVVASANTGDFVYFDPPYVPLNATSSFTAYQAGGFGPDHQRRLRDCAESLIKRGVAVVLSNSSADTVRELYSGPAFELREVSAVRAINSRADRRGAIKELLIRGHVARAARSA